MKIADVIREKLAVTSSFKQVFGTEDGQRVLRHILKMGFVTSTTFVAGDPHRSAMNEGSRRLALSILKLVHSDPKKLVDQLTEEMKNE